MKQFLFAAILGSVLASPAWADDAANAESPQHATTAEGERIILNPDGSWRYADDAEPAQKKAASRKDCPPGSQGGWFGTRCVPPGDKDFNRGSLSGKGR
ncbi:hypothetical protein LG198_10175 [Methylobacillus arboreus]|uniref:hypothetical protein n=1 Tax=Methylobacillus arboreus TaxID=755170 RepID=UPI001E4BC187|nr:hypothetical protein [Methylobacillus arboreus]MCB5191094.1 hypothetical protein [Methylobacillus arboreus]